MNGPFFRTSDHEIRRLRKLAEAGDVEAQDRLEAVERRLRANGMRLTKPVHVYAPPWMARVLDMPLIPRTYPTPDDRTLIRLAVNSVRSASNPLTFMIAQSTASTLDAYLDEIKVADNRMFERVDPTKIKRDQAPTPRQQRQDTMAAIRSFKRERY